MVDPLLQVADLTVAFSSRRRVDVRPVVGPLSLTVNAGQRVGLLGESGSGKSLIALAAIGLLPDTAVSAGSVRWRGREMLAASDRAWSTLRGAEVGMVFQEPMTALDPTMTVGRQVAEVVRLHARADGEPARDVVIDIFAAVGLADPGAVAERYPFQLSGGQRQRVVLATALVNRPDLIICDEPTTALDVTVQARVLRVLTDALDASRMACLFISHDLAVVAQVCTDVLVLLDGEVVERGAVADVFTRPQHPYTAGLVATSRLDDLPPGARLPTLEDFWSERRAAG